MTTKYKITIDYGKFIFEDVFTKDGNSRYVCCDGSLDDLDPLNLMGYFTQEELDEADATIEEIK